MKYLVVFLVFIGVTGTAFGSHEDEQEIHFSDPLMSIQNDKANIIWESYNQEESAIIFTQLVNGKTTLEPKNIATGSFIGNPKILSEEQNIFVLYELTTRNGDVVPQFYVLTSNDDGKTFSEPKLILATDDVYYDITNVEFVNEKLYVFGTMWTRGENTSYAFYSVSSDFGDTFSEPSKLFNQGKVRQDIVTTTSNGVIYLLMDDEKDFDEKGHLYLFKILPDGTVSDKVSVNKAETSVTNQKIAVSGKDVYVSWLDRPNDTRWYSSFAASHDGGMTFEKSKYLPSDPDSIDTYHPERLGISVIDETLNVFWESDYWDGKNQTIITFVGTSNNKGNDFQMEEIPASSYVRQYGRVFILVDSDKQYYFAAGVKNYPYENSALYFNVKDKNGNYSEMVDILQDYQIKAGHMIADVNNGFIHIVTDADYHSNCILYHYSSDDGKNFNDLIDLAKLGTDKECLGAFPDIEPPLKQIANGVSKNNIECATNVADIRILMLKKSDDKPVCILHEHILPLQKRGYIDENSFTKFAIMTGEQFMQSMISEQKGTMQNLALKYNGQRDSLPPHVSIAGTFESDRQLYPNAKPYENNIYRYTVGMAVQNINALHIAVLDNKWDLLENKFVDSESQETVENNSVKYPTILTIEDPINKRNLLPVAITDVDTNVKGEAVWDRFSIANRNGDTRGTVWDDLPRGSSEWKFVDEHGNDAWDDSVINRDNYAVIAIGITYLAICDDRRIDITNGISPTIPILPEIDTVYMTEKGFGILPNNMGNYHVEFLSLYPTLVNLPQNATDAEIETILCILEQPKDKTGFAYFTEIDFRLSD